MGQQTMTGPIARAVATANRETDGRFWRGYLPRQLRDAFHGVGPVQLHEWRERWITEDAVDPSLREYSPVSYRLAFLGL